MRTSWIWLATLCLAFGCTQSQMTGGNRPTRTRCLAGVHQARQGHAHQRRLRGGPSPLARYSRLHGRQSICRGADEIARAPTDAQGHRCQVVLPGATRTLFYRYGDRNPDEIFPADKIMEPEVVVNAALKGLEMGELVCIPTLRIWSGSGQVRGRSQGDGPRAAEPRCWGQPGWSKPRTERRPVRGGSVRAGQRGL